MDLNTDADANGKLYVEKYVTKDKKENWVYTDGAFTVVKDLTLANAQLKAASITVSGNVTMTDSQVDEIKAAKEKLMESAQKLFAKLYEAQQAAGAGAAGAGPDMGAGAGADAGAAGANPYGDDVVDGDYKEV